MFRLLGVLFTIHRVFFIPPQEGAIHATDGPAERLVLVCSFVRVGSKLTDACYFPSPYSEVLSLRLPSSMASSTSAPIPQVSPQSNTSGSPELRKLSMLKSWWSEVDQQVAMQPPRWLARASTLSFSKHQSSLGRVAFPLELTGLYTPPGRYHIGESLIPSVKHYLRFIGAEDKVANHGFVVKVGRGFQ